MNAHADIQEELILSTHGITLKYLSIQGITLKSSDSKK